MKKQLFDELMHSMTEALEHASGRRELRTTVLPARPEPFAASDVRALRDTVNASQAVFASFLNVSPALVRAWEAGRRRPEGAALRLLEIAARNPGTVFGRVTPSRHSTGVPASKRRAKPARSSRA